MDADEDGDGVLIDDVSGRATTTKGKLESAKEDTAYQNKTTFAVESGEPLSAEVLEMAARYAEIAYGEKNWNDIVDYVWSTDENGDNPLELPIPWSALENETKVYVKPYLRAAVDSDQLSDCTVSAVDLPEGADLVVADLPEEEEKSKADLDQVLEEKSSYRNVDIETALQLDISLKKDGQEVDSDGKVTIKLDLPVNFVKAVTENDKAIVVIHFGKNGSEVITPEKYQDNGQLKGIQFGLSDFSPVIIAMTDQKLVKVTVKPAKNGTAVVYSQVRDEQNNVLTRTYVPVGKTVEIPAGTDLILDYDGFRNEEEDGYYLVEYDNWTVLADGEDDSPHSSIYHLPNNVGEVEITPDFTLWKYNSDNSNKMDYLFYCSNTNDWTYAMPINTPLYCSVRNPETDTFRRADATDWKLVDDLSGLEGYDPEDIDNSGFTLTSDGILTSKGELQAGEYRIYASCMVNGEPRKGTVYLTIGVRVSSFNVYFGHYKTDQESNTIAYDGLTQSRYYDANEAYFGTILADRRDEEPYFPDEIAMYGYEFAGWFTDGMDGALEDDTKLTKKQTRVSACFKEADSGSWYDPEIETGSVDDSNDPNDPNDPNKPGTVTPPGSNGGNSGNGSHGGSGSGGGSGSSGRSVTSGSANTMTGNWQQDETGWRFLQTNGSYATNQWGKINGNWYYFDAASYAVTGWNYINGIWYYLNPTPGDNQCKMVTGWIFDQTYGRWFYLNPTNESGALLTGWQQINNVWYYLNPVADGTYGAMLADQWVGDYYVNADGAWVEGMTR